MLNNPIIFLSPPSFKRYIEIHVIQVFKHATIDYLPYPDLDVFQYYVECPLKRTVGYLGYYVLVVSFKFLSTDIFHMRYGTFWSCCFVYMGEIEIIYDA